MNLPMNLSNTDLSPVLRLRRWVSPLPSSSSLPYLSAPEAPDLDQSGHILEYLVSNLVNLNKIVLHYSHGNYLLFTFALLWWLAGWWVEWLESEVRLRLLKRGRYIINTGTRTFLRLTLTSLAQLLTCPGGFPNIVSIKTFSSKTAARFSLATDKNSYFLEREGELWQCQCQCYWINYETGVQFQRNGKSPEISLTLLSLWKPHMYMETWK